MAVNRRVQSVSFPATGDLSARQFHILIMDSSGQVDVAAGSTKPMVGILMNKPAAATRGAEVAIAGSEVKFEGNSAVATGDLVTSGASGFGTAVLGGTALGTAYVVGVCTQACGGSAQLGGVMVNPFKYIAA